MADLITVSAFSVRASDLNFDAVRTSADEVKKPGDTLVGGVGDIHATWRGLAEPAVYVAPESDRVFVLMDGPRDEAGRVKETYDDVAGVLTTYADALEGLHGDLRSLEARVVAFNGEADQGYWHDDATQEWQEDEDGVGHWVDVGGYVTWDKDDGAIAKNAGLWSDLHRLTDKVTEAVTTCVTGINRLNPEELIDSLPNPVYRSEVRLDPARLAELIDQFGDDPYVMSELIKKYGATVLREAAGELELSLRTIYPPQEVAERLTAYSAALALGVNRLSVPEQRKFATDLMDMDDARPFTDPDGVGDPFTLGYHESLAAFILAAGGFPITVYERAATILDGNNRDGDPGNDYPPAASITLGWPGALTGHDPPVPLDLADAIFSGLARDPAVALAWFTTPGEADTFGDLAGAVIGAVQGMVPDADLGMYTAKIEYWMGEYDWGHFNAEGITKVMAVIGSSPEAGELAHAGRRSEVDQEKWERIQLFITDAVTALGGNVTLTADTTTEPARINMAESLTYMWDSIILANASDEVDHDAASFGGNDGPPQIAAAAETKDLGSLVANPEQTLVYSGSLGSLNRLLSLTLYDPNEGVWAGDPSGQEVVDRFPPAYRIVMEDLGTAWRDTMADAAKLEDAGDQQFLFGGAMETVGQVAGSMAHMSNEVNDARDAAHTADVQMWWDVGGFVVGEGAGLLAGPVGVVAAAGVDVLTSVLADHYLEADQIRDIDKAEERGDEILGQAQDAVAFWLEQQAVLFEQEHPGVKLTDEFDWLDDSHVSKGSSSPVPSPLGEQLLHDFEGRFNDGYLPAVNDDNQTHEHKVFPVDPGPSEGGKNIDQVPVLSDGFRP
jgi:hypothetical protein